MIRLYPGRAQWQPPRDPRFDPNRATAAIKHLIRTEVKPEVELSQLGAWCDGMPTIDFLEDLSCCATGLDCPAATGPFVLANRRYGIPTLLTTKLGRPFAGTSGPPEVTGSAAPAEANATRLYAANGYHGATGKASVISKSLTSGSAWSPLTTPWPTYSLHNVSCLRVAPSDRRLIYAATINLTDAMYRSADLGATWTARGVGLPSDGYVLPLALAVHPTDASFALLGISAASGNRIYRTTSKGDLWSPMGAAWTTGGVPIINAVVISPATPATSYASAFKSGAYRGVMRALDSGVTWADSSAGITFTSGSSQPYALAVDPVTAATVYLGMYANNPGIFKSTDGGANWSGSATGLPATSAVVALAIDPVTPSRIYAANYVDGIYRSTDSGANWTRVLVANIYAIAVNALTPAHVYAAGDAGVFRSQDYGDTWSAINSGLPTYASAAPSYSALAIDPTTP